MKRLSLFVSIFLLISYAYAQPVQLNQPEQDKRVVIPLRGEWIPDAPAANVGVENFTVLNNLRYTDKGLETVEGYSKITSTALSSTPVSSFHFIKDSVSEVITKAYTGAYYLLFRNTTAIPGVGDYNASDITQDTYYITYTGLDSSPGFYSDGPNGLMMYSDSSIGALIYGSDYVDPNVVFVSSDAALPITEFNNYTEESNNSGLNFTYNSAAQQWLYIGSPWLITDLIVDIDTANVSASTLTMTVWDGSAWTSKTITDGTKTGGIALAQDGTIAITSSATTPKVSIINNQQYYWYRLDLSAGSAIINSIKLRVPLQRPTDTWNESGRTCIGFHVFRNSEYEDYTYQVAQQSTVDAPFAATIGGIDGSDRIELVFEEPIQGIYVKMLEGLTNKKAVTISGITYWNGTTYASISGVLDETLDSGATKTLNQSGVVSWSANSNAAKPHEVFGVYGYHYRIVLTGAVTDSQDSITSTNISFTNATSTINLSSGSWPDFEVGDEIYISGSGSNDSVQTISQVNGANIIVYGTIADEAAGASVTIYSYKTTKHDGTSIDSIYGITMPLTLTGYDGVGYYNGRIMLIDGNKVDYSLPNQGWVFNGVNTSNEGSPNASPLYFGNKKQITATHSLSNRYGSNIIQSWIVTKNDETYTLTGSQPYSDYSEPFIIRKMSSTIGCPAPMTMKEVQIQLEDIQRNGLIWLDSTGPVIFDGAVIAPIRGIENYFDPENSEYIKTSLIEKATAYYDATHYEYNLIFPSGTNATANNMWLVYDLKHRKWYRKAHGPLCGGGCGAGETCTDGICLPSNEEIPISTISVSDTDGIKYSYGNLSSGHLVRLDNSEYWDTEPVRQHITNGIFSPPVIDDMGFWSRSKINGIKILPGIDANGGVLLMHMNGVDENTTFIDHAGNTMTAQSDAQIDTAAYKYGNASALFDGTDDYISTPDSSDWDISTDWTIDAWVKHDDHVGNEAYISQYEDSDNYWEFFHAHTVGLYFFIVSGGSAIVSVDQYTGSEISDTDWHHVAVVKVSNKYGLYLDGTQVGYSSDADIDTFAGTLTIGSAGSTNFFDGHIDDIRIYQRNIFNADPASGNTDTITVPSKDIFGYAEISLYYDGTVSDQTQLVALDVAGIESSDSYGYNNFSQQGNFFQVDISAITTLDKWNPLAWGYKAQFIREN